MLTHMFPVTIWLGIAMGGPLISDPATWPGNAPPEYPIALPVKNEIRGFFDLAHDAGGFKIAALHPDGPGPVYRLQLTRAQRDQFAAFLSYTNFRPSGASAVTCLCDGIVAPDKAVHLRWANLFWVDRR